MSTASATARCDFSYKILQPGGMAVSHWWELGAEHLCAITQKVI